MDTDRLWHIAKIEARIETRRDYTSEDAAEYENALPIIQADDELDAEYNGILEVIFDDLSFLDE